MDYKKIINTVYHPHFQACVILLSILLVFFWREFFLGQIFSPADMLYDYYPWKYLVSENFISWNNLRVDDVFIVYPDLSFFWSSIQAGLLPLWNPYELSGCLAYEGAVGSVFYPFNIVYLLFPLAYARGIFVLLLLFFAGFFMYLFLSKIGVTHFGSIIGAIIFMLNGVFVVWLSSVIPMVGIFLPMGLLLIEYYFEKNKVIYILLLSLVIGSICFVGHIPSILIFLTIIFFYIAFKFISTHSDGNLFRRLLSLSGAGLLGLILASATIIPVYFYLINSTTVISRVKSFSYLPLENLITYINPNFWGNPIYHNWSTIGNYCEWISYFGIISIFLVLIAILFVWKNKYAAFFILLSIFSLGYTYGVVPFQYIGYIPGFVQCSNIRWVLGANLAFSVLAGFGADILLSSKRSASIDNIKLKILCIGSAIVILLGLILAYFSIYSQSIIPILNHFIESDWFYFESLLILFVGLVFIYGLYSQKKSIYSITFILIFISYILFSYNITLYPFDIKFHLINVLNCLMFLSLGLLLLFGYLDGIFTKRTMKILLIILITADLLLFGINYNPSIEKEKLYVQTPGINYLMEDHDYFRIIQIGNFPSPIPGNTVTVFKIPTILGYDITVDDRYHLFLSKYTNNSYEEISTSGYFIIPALKYSHPVDLLNVKYIVTDPNHPKFIRDINQNINTYPVGEIYGQISQGQSFVSKNNNLSQIDVLMATYGNKLGNQSVIFHLKNNPENSDDLVTKITEASKIKDNEFYSFDFLPINNSAGKTYYFSIESPESNVGDAVTIWANSEDVYYFGSHYSNNVQINGDLCFSTYFDDLENYSLVYSGDDLVIYKNKNFLPRAWFVQQFEILNDTQIINKISNVDFDPRNTVLLTQLPSNIQNDTFTKSDSNITITKYSPNEIVINVNNTAPGFLVLSERTSPGWNVFVDGNESEILEADYLLRSVYLNSGQHEIVFVFQPIWIIIPVLLSIFTFCIIIIVILILILKKRY